jgi:hypothetical protein
MALVPAAHRQRVVRATQRGYLRDREREAWRLANHSPYFTTHGIVSDTLHVPTNLEMRTQA